MPLFRETPLPDFTTDGSIQSYVEDAVNNLPAKFAQYKSQLGVALFDLTGSPDNPRYGGWNDSENFFVGSLAKIGAMYAAYQLQSYIDECATLYNGKVDQFFSSTQAEVDRLVKGQVARVRNDSPDLSKIFALEAGAGEVGVVNWTSTHQTRAQLADMDDPDNYGAIKNTGFWEQLKLMIMWSSNCGASCCIETLGFTYIDAALRQAGLFDPNAAPPAGIWLGASYSGGCPANPRRFYFPFANPDIYRVLPPSQNGPDDHAQIATPRSVARLLLAIANNSLAVPVAVTEIETLMDKSDPATASPIAMGLQANGMLPDPLPPPTGNSDMRRIRVYSKLGIGSASFCDCALIQADISTNGIAVPLSFGLVVLGAPRLGVSITSDVVIGQIAQMLCGSLAARNAGAVKPH